MLTKKALEAEQRSTRQRKKRHKVSRYPRAALSGVSHYYNEKTLPADMVQCPEDSSGLSKGTYVSIRVEDGVVLPRDALP